MAGLLVSVAGNLLGRITEAAGRPEFRHIRSELKSLETTVSNLKAIIRDAEERQASDSELYGLLKRLKDAFSMADSLIEDLECEYLRWRVQNRKKDVDEKGCQFSSCFSSNFLVSPSETANKINQITKILDMIEESMSKFSLFEDDNEHIKRLKGEMTLRTCITGSQAFARLLHLRKEAILSDNADSIIGRDEAKQSIIAQLLKDEDDKQKSPRILSIHGDGGMGKTALAKLVYNARQVFNHFDKRMWICVSEDFDVQRIRREVLSSATGEKVTDALTDGHLLIRLQRNFFGKKFLLVLDDFGDLDPDRVFELERIVKMGANGSKIMITTRSQETLTDATTHKIEKLNEEKSIYLFESTIGRERLTKKVEELKELVRNCGGAPLAIKCLAGMLSSTARDVVEWPNVEDLCEKWKREELNEGGCVLRVLRLSYDLLPSYLKPCFICFSLLPKDYVFYSFELIQLWMAQGVLHSGSEDNPEAVGEQYFIELQSRGLLEDVEEHTLGYWFKIHNLVHDFAVQQAKEQKNLENLLLSFANYNKDFPPSTNHDIRLLSIPVGGGAEPKIINGVPLFKSITKFRQLRFLYLCNSSVEEIPTSIDTLKHLRYLDLRGNQRLKRLPESICKLQSLQTLILAFCSELEELPRNIKNMISLRFLWIQTNQANLGKDGIGSLTSLRFLAIGGSENLTHLFEDIDKLTALQTLIIYDCKSLLTLPKGLESLSSLCNMALWGCERLRLTFSLELLRLKKLILRGLTAVGTLPKSIYRLDETLQVLEIGEFSTLRVLPFWLSNYWELRILGISNCPWLEAYCMPSNLHFCDKMKELRITFCGSLSEASMEESKHECLHISHIPTIYVDAKKIKPRVTSTDKHEAASGARQTEEEAKHGVQNDDHESDDGVESKHDNIGIPGLSSGEHDRGTNNNRLEADNESHVETGQPLKAEHDHEQTVATKQDDASDNESHVDAGQTMALKLDGITGESHVEAKQTIEAKKDGAADEESNKKHVEVGKIEGLKLGETNEDGHGKVCLGDNDNGGANQAMVITYEGF